MRTTWLEAETCPSNVIISNFDKATSLTNQLLHAPLRDLLYHRHPAESSAIYHLAILNKKVNQ